MKSMRLHLICLVLALAFSALRAEPTVMDGVLARRLLDPALMCLAIYTDAEVTGWDGPQFQIAGFDLSAGPGGLHAGIYHYEADQPRGHARVILAYRGTEPGARDDWTTDLTNFFGLAPDAYLEAVKWAQAARCKAQQTGVNDMVLTGHSLGGGLACFAALQLGIPAYGFGSAALGEGLQKILKGDVPQNLARADVLVTHVFMQDDPVPPLTALRGTHPGLVPQPLLAPRQDYARLRSPVEKAALWAVAGLLTDKWLAATARTLKEHVAESHGIDFYIAALAALIAPPGRFDPCGQWSSQGSFFDLTSTDTQFLLSQNGRLRLNNHITILDKFHQRLSDVGDWEYQQPLLTMRIRGLGVLVYELVAGEGGQISQWKRIKLAPDTSKIEAAATEQERKVARLTASVVAAAMKTMEGKTVMWQRVPLSEMLSPAE
jgi:hypothetical protein